MRSCPFSTMNRSGVRGRRTFSGQATRLCSIWSHFSNRSASLGAFMISWTRAQGSLPSASRSISVRSYSATATSLSNLEGEILGQLPEGPDLLAVVGRERHGGPPHVEDGLRHVLPGQDLLAFLLPPLPERHPALLPGLTDLPAPAFAGGQVDVPLLGLLIVGRHHP